MNDDTVVGYRSIRSLDEGPSSYSILACARELDDAAGPRALKALSFFPPDVAYVAMLKTIECAVRASGPHVRQIVDIAAGPDGRPVLVFNWCTATTLRKLLRERSSLRIGEAITILAPLCAALCRIHRAGVVLGSITADSIHFDSMGQPIFNEIAAAQLNPAKPTRAIVMSERVFVEDRTMFSTMASGVLAAVRADTSDETRVAALVDWMMNPATVSSVDWEHQFESRLFALGAPEPVRIGAHSAETVEIQSSHIRGGTIAGGDFGELPLVGVAAASGVSMPLQLRLTAAIDSVVGSVRGAAATLPRWWGSLSTRMKWVGIAGVLLCGLAISVAIIDDGIHVMRDDAASARPVTNALPPANSDGSEATHPLVSTPAPPPPLTPGANDLDDPHRALVVLLSIRAECFRVLSTGCLERVTTLDSPAYAMDSEWIEEIRSGGEVGTVADFEGALPVEVERLGDSVMFDLGSVGKSKPASLLLVKGEAGWRIRSYTLPR